MGDIVCGVDGSEHSKDALRWAAEEAVLRATSVRAVLAWSYLDQHTPDGFRPDFTDDDARALVQGIIDDVVPEAQRGAITPSPVCDLPARALLDAAEGADLIVVAARGLGGIKGALLGSVSHHVLQHAGCPVVVIPARRPR